MSANRTKPNSLPGADGGGSTSTPGVKIENNTTGRVKFDDRGNAVWEWAVRTPELRRDEDPTDRMLALEDPSLSVAPDAPTVVDAPVKPNPLGTKKGYDPYDSGKLGKRPGPRVKTDLRRLSEFMKLQRQAAGNKDGGPEKDENQREGVPGQDGEPKKSSEI